MITDIPNESDFKQSGLALFNHAWDSVLSLYLGLDSFEADEESEEDIAEMTRHYWGSAQTTLSTSLALVQQGTEFLLKGRISAVSPFLLLSGEPRYWPRGNNRNDVRFAEFRSIDAQDLVRVHDTISPERLSDSFKTRFEELRRLRNARMHTVDSQSSINPKDVISDILHVCDSLVRPDTWINLRRIHLENEPHTHLFGSNDDLDYHLACEINKVIDLLDRQSIIKHFDFKKNQRRYFCYACHISTWEYGNIANLAQLRPNEPSSTTLHCVLCGQNSVVERRPCRHLDCRSNVIEPEDNVCLTCLEEQ